VLKRIPAVVLAAAAHLALAVAVWYLFPFLQGFAPPSTTYDSPWWWLIDGLLVLQFCAPHSLLLAPPVRNRLEALLPSALHGCFFCLTTCLSLLLLIFAWQRTPVVVWRLEGWAAWPVCGAYLLSWGGLLYSLSLTGYGWQTGWTPFWAWFRGLPAPRRRFAERGAYRWLRHPVYLAFLGQIWLTPTATLDRLLMMSLLTVYVVVGSCLKDRRMLFYLGDAYRRYQARVTGYPLVGFGPLGRVKSGERRVVPDNIAIRETGAVGALPCRVAAKRLSLRTPLATRHSPLFFTPTSPAPARTNWPGRCFAARRAPRSRAGRWRCMGWRP
jgi:methanethiol S-methyltransferase